MSKKPAVWFPTVRTGTGTDVFTERLVVGLRQRDIRAEITWLPLRAEYAPWTVPIPQPPESATVVHVNTWLHPRFLPANLPVVATIHHSMHHPDARAHKGLLRSLYHRHWIAPNERRVLRRANHVVAVSQFVANTAKQALVNVPMQVIYNGVDTETFRPGCRQRQPDEPFRLLYVGGWKALKGVDMLAPIMRELGNGFELRYTGGKAAERERPSMPHNMYDIGRLHDGAAVAAAMNDSDALLFPSRSEGFGLVVAEAMACGLPTVAARSTALIELIDDGETGFLCTPDDVMAFVNGVRSLAKNQECVTAMKNMARNQVMAKFSDQRVIFSYLELYQSLLSSRHCFE